MKIFKEPLEFHWDKGNIDKNEAPRPALCDGVSSPPASAGSEIRRSRNSFAFIHGHKPRFSAKADKKHNVENNEVEEPFFDRKRVIFKDILHSEKEDRFILIGKTKKKRLLYTVFTMRGKKVRIISSRDVNKKEVQMYEKRT